MGLSAFRDTATMQTAKCDHAGTTTVTDQMCTCSACGAWWPIDTKPPVVSVIRQVPL